MTRKTPHCARTAIAFLPLLVTLTAAAAAQEGSRTLQGVVQAAADSQPLRGVRVSVIGTDVQTVTDDLGRFALRRLPAVTIRLVLSGLALRTDTVTVAPSVNALRIFLHSRAVLLPPVIAEEVSPERLRFRTRAQTSTMELDPSIIRGVPALAEPDVARAAQLLPGVTAKNDFSTGLVVRGGESDQALIRVDDVVVLNPSHLGGVFSMFDHNAIETATIATGGFPARYGGRLSSVLDVTLRDGRRDRMGVTGAVSLLSAKALVEGPIGGGSYLAGARRSYADEIADTFTDERFTYWFGDAIARVHGRVPVLGEAALTGYWGRDRLAFVWFEETADRPGTDLEVEWGNRLVGVQFRQGSGRVQVRERASITEFDAGVGWVPDVFRFDNRAVVAGGEVVLSADIAGGHRLDVGAGYESHRLTYTSHDLALDRRVLDERYTPGVWSAFVDQQWRLGNVALLRPGVRLEHVPGAGHTALDPRVSAKVFLRRNLALTGSAGRFHQVAQSLRDFEQPMVIFDVWVGADQYTPVARSDHVIAGIEWWPHESVSLAVEGYEKTFENLLVSNPFQDPDVRGDEFDVSNGWSHGFDVLLRRHGRTLRGWVAYSYAKAERRTATDTFPPAHDRRHTVDVVLELPGPLGSRLGVRWGYGSPLPYTEITGQWIHRRWNPNLRIWDFAETEPISTEINGARYPPYHRLDLSFRWAFDVWGGTLRPYLSVVNAYDRRNVFVYSYDYRTVPATRSGWAQLPLLPTVGVEFEW